MTALSIGQRLALEAATAAGLIPAAIDDTEVTVGELAERVEALEVRVESALVDEVPA